MTTERHTLDAVFKQYTIRFIQVRHKIPADIESEVEVSRLPRKIDLLITAETAEAQAQLRMETPFQQISRYNQIEFKGQNDRLDVWDYLRILARTSLYMGENKIPFDQMSVNIVCASTPRKVLDNRYAPHVFEQIDDGRYQRPGYPQLTIIAINELPEIEQNYPLLMFASSEKKFRRFLDKVLSEEKLDYAWFAYPIRPQITEELLHMAGIYTIPRENMEFIVDHIGHELIHIFTPEQRLEGISPQQRLEGISPTDLAQNLRPEVIDAMLIKKQLDTVCAMKSPEKRIEMFELLFSDDVALLSDEKIRQQLLVGLSSADQEQISEWIEEKL